MYPELGDISAFCWLVRGTLYQPPSGFVHTVQCSNLLTVRTFWVWFRAATLLSDYSTLLDVCYILCRVCRTFRSTVEGEFLPRFYHIWFPLYRIYQMLATCAIPQVGDTFVRHVQFLSACSTRRLATKLLGFILQCMRTSCWSGSGAQSRTRTYTAHLPLSLLDSRCSFSSMISVHIMNGCLLGLDLTICLICQTITSIFHMCQDRTTYERTRLGLTSLYTL